MTFRNRLLLLVALLTLGFSTMTFAQQDKSKRPSPPAKAEASVGDLNIAIHYNSPAVKGREIWGKLVPYGDVWRTGANEATTFEINKDVTIEGQKLAAGKYALFTIPGENEWTIIFNKDASQWGAYNYDKNKDALRVTVKPGKAAAFQETLNFAVNAENGTGVVVFTWENSSFSFKVKKA